MRAVCRTFALLALLIAPLTLVAETCMSPFIKRLDRPEKYLYVFCVSMGKHHDQLITVDVERGSKTYGQVIHQLDLGSSGNETHHFGFTDDRTHIWGCSLFSHTLFVINVADDPAKPKLVKTIDSAGKAGLTGPHSPYAIPGRMLISFLGGKDEGVPAGLAEFENDGSYIRTIQLPEGAPYGYDVAIKPSLNRMVTSSFTPPRNYRKPLVMMDLKAFGDKLIVWDFRERKPLQILKTGPAPLECRWSLADGANYGFCNCALENSLWVWEGQKDGTYTTRKLTDCGKLPADLSQSPDGRYLYVSCFMSDEIQAWDVSDLKNPKLASTVSPGVHPNMMHVTMDGKRMYVTNSLLSTMDRTSDFWIKLVRIGPEGLQVDPEFNIDLTKLPGGPVRGHDMLLNSARQ